MLKSLVIAALMFLTAGQTANSSLRQMRMTPAEIAASGAGEEQTGGAGSAAGQRRVLFGDPATAGYYSILLFVPAHTTIQAHSHRDNRMATVVSGEWHFGYGNEFDAAALKTLPPGSVYSADLRVRPHRHPLLRPQQRSSRESSPLSTNY